VAAAIAATALSVEQRALLGRWVAAQKTPQSVALRARIVLAAAAGESNSEIARTLGVSRPTVILWRRRFDQGGTAALTETKPGRGRKPAISAAKVKQIVQATTQTKPPGQTHWSCRSMAKAQGVSAATVQRIWDAHGLKPHRLKTFKLSNDPHFTEKLTDVVGLYLNPPEKAIVLCVDEKSQIQALDRTQPGLPLKPGRCGTMTHDYKRHGTTTLFAALNVLDGTVIGRCMQRQRHEEFIRFLNAVEGDVPAGKLMARHPRWSFHSPRPRARG
jgi:transposase